MHNPNNFPTDKQLEISTKSPLDAASQLPIPENYMRWTLMSAEGILGKAELEKLLVKNNLEKLIDNYPPATPTLSSTLTIADHSNISADIVRFYGYAGRQEVIEIGRLSAKPALEIQAKIFNFLARKAAKLLPLSMQIKTVLDATQNYATKLYAGSEYSADVIIENRGDKWAYIDESCMFCAGKVSNDHICWIWNGTLEESLKWLTEKTLKIEQVECRAKGDATCTWEIDKTPL